MPPVVHTSTSKRQQLTETEPDTKLSRFWLILAACFAIFIALPMEQPDAGFRRLRGLKLAHDFFQWLLVEPMGHAGAVAFVMACGGFAAWLSWPRVWGASRDE